MRKKLITKSLLTWVLAALAFAASSSATTYHHQSSGLALRFQIEGNRVAKYGLGAVMHCNDGSRSPFAFAYGRSNVPIGSRHGFFISSGGTPRVYIDARVRPRVIVGRFRATENAAAPGAPKCSTGRDYQHPWVRFRAPRVRGG